jgi:hypothetical protein
MALTLVDAKTGARVAHGFTQDQLTQILATQARHRRPGRMGPDD